jgi:hypothetical protein
MKMSQLLPKISHNYFWVLPNADYDQVAGLYIFDVFNPTYRFSIKGKIIACPQTIHKPNFANKNTIGKDSHEYLLKKVRLSNAHTCEFASQVEILPDDTVWFNYNQHFYKQEIANQDGKPLILVDSDRIYMIERAGEKIMCNGYIWVEQILVSDSELMQAKYAGIWGSDKKAKLGVGIIKTIGTPNAAYRDENTKYQDFSEAKIGQKIYFRNTAPTAEWGTHQEINQNGELPYLRIQRKDILAYVC